MKNYFVAKLLFVFALLCSTKAFAEIERYDFPSLPSTGLRSLDNSMPPTPKKETIRQQFNTEAEMFCREVQKDSIADLLQKYNKRLSDEKADVYAGFIIQASEKFQQDPFLIAAVVVTESSARHDAVSKGGDYGLMQVRWRVHQKKIRQKYPHITKPSDMFHPEYNLLVGTEIFSTYHATAKQDVKNALLYYSSGNQRLTQKVFSVIDQLEKTYTQRLKNS